MSKKDFVKAIADDANVPFAVVNSVLKSMAKVTAQTLVVGGTVKLPEIATIHAKDYAARPGRNPKTGESCEVPAGRRIRMKASATLVSAFEAASAETD